MRHRVAAKCLSIALLVGVPLLPGCDSDEPEEASIDFVQPDAAASVSDRQTASVIGVDAFMRAGSEEEQPMVIEGVVSAVSSDENMMALIDRLEYEQCSSLSCAKLTLPVRWVGPMPRLGQTVHATGRVADEDSGKVFVAQTLNAVEVEAR